MTVEEPWDNSLGEKWIAAIDGDDDLTVLGPLHEVGQVGLGRGEERAAVIVSGGLIVIVAEIRKLPTYLELSMSALLSRPQRQTCNRDFSVFNNRVLQMDFVVFVHH